jgi:2-polyprenyl-3-methyl-5-hydroxy-6-metoxy-1,4-benzoquinol methylase
MSNRKENKNQLYEEHPFRISKAKKWVDRADRVNGQRILVAGCGGGERVLNLAAKGAEVTAIDQSETAMTFLEDAFDRLPIASPELITAELQEVELPTDEFDYIYCIGVLHHMIDPQPAVQLFADTCKSDGEIEILVYNKNSPKLTEMRLVSQASRVLPLAGLLSKNTKDNLNWWDKYENPVTKPFTRDEIVTLLRTEGFTITSIEYVFDIFDTGVRSLIPPIFNHILKRTFKEHRGGIHIRACPR